MFVFSGHLYVIESQFLTFVPNIPFIHLSVCDESYVQPKVDMIILESSPVMTEGEGNQAGGNAAHIWLLFRRRNCFDFNIDDI